VKGIRNWESKEVKQPIPVILDPNGRWGAKEESKVLRLTREGKGKPPVWIVGREAAARRVGGSWSARSRVEGVGGAVVYPSEGKELRSRDGRGVDWGVVLELLGERGIRSVMIEGGARVIGDLLRRENQGFVGSVIVTVAPVWLGRGGVVVLPEKGDKDADKGREVGRLEGVRGLPMGEDVVLCGRFGRGGL
jgi:2,5-diamino-6-(ribosylamino)-4(3H)-pyrimidinone 5'-phosphate reductase